MLYTFYKDKLANYGKEKEDSVVVEYTESIISNILFSVVNKDFDHHHIFGSNMEDTFIDNVVRLLRGSFPDSTIIKYTIKPIENTTIETGMIIMWA